MTENESLNDEQKSALFDILSHYETYSEIEDFKSPNAIKQYGPPFQDGTKSSSPILQNLVSKFALRLPGLRDISADFWKVRVYDLIEELSKAELSESYDKGVLGVRKTLATAVSALLEYPARGCLGGFPKDSKSFEERSYDKTKGDDVLTAWRDFLQQLVYGDLFDTLFKQATETDDLSQHGELTQAAHEFVVVNLASFLHYTLILSPEGPSLLRMLENLHKLAPYMMIRQTLKVGNVATMISGMMKLMLAKVSISTVTNWLGVSSGADEGMNLLQQIMSTVLGWDKKELKKRSDKLEKEKDAPSKDIRDALREWTGASREEHLECRNRSREQSMSIVAVILSLSSSSAEMSETQHAKALEYLSLQLAIRDRREIVDVLCHHNPDHLTQAIRDGVSAYEPMIRQVHQAVDLSATVGDFQAYMDDMIKLAKPAKDSKDGATPPSVEDFVKLLHTHQGASHRFLHQVAKNGKEVTQWFHEYVHEAAAEFRQDTSDSTKPNVIDQMAKAYDGLSSEDRTTIRKEINAHSKYLSDLHAASASRIKDVVGNETNSKFATLYGPGAYLARWQQLLDSTLITPATAEGPVRKGGNKAVKEDSSKNIEGVVGEGKILGEDLAEQIVSDRQPEAPSTEETVKLLGKKFREVLMETCVP